MIRKLNVYFKYFGVLRIFKVMIFKITHLLDMILYSSQFIFLIQQTIISLEIV